MKKYTINIASKLQNVEISVKNGRKFEQAAISGEYGIFYIEVAEKDIKRVKQFAVKYGDDKSSCRGNWYAHCNGFAMDLCVTNAGKHISINTWRGYGLDKKITNHQ